MKKYIEDTIAYYDRVWESYEKTWNVDFVEDIEFTPREKFLEYLPPKAHILDLGCGSGRDSIYFQKRGFKVTALDGSSKMCELTKKLTGLPVIQKNFLEIDFEEHFDAIFACASLLHLNDEDLKKSISLCSKSLKNKSYFYISFKLGEGTRMKEDRYFNDMTEEKFTRLISDSPELMLIDCWVSYQYKSHIPFINFIMQKDKTK